MESTGSGFQQINSSKWWNEINLGSRGKPDSLTNNYIGKLTIKVAAVVIFPPAIKLVTNLVLPSILGYLLENH